MTPCATRLRDGDCVRVASRVEQLAVAPGSHSGAARVVRVAARRVSHAGA
jgi:hypothetical protein